MKLDPPQLLVGGLSGAIYVVTHGKMEGYAFLASRKYDVTKQFVKVAAELGYSFTGEGSEETTERSEFEERKVVVSFYDGPLDGQAGFVPDLRPIQLSEGTYRFNGFHPEGDAEFEWGSTFYPGVDSEQEATQ